MYLVTNFKFFLYVEIKENAKSVVGGVGVGVGKCVKGDVKELPVMG